MANDNDALTLPIEFPNADRTQLQLEEVLKSLDGLTRKILESGAASEQNARKILALTTSFAEGKKSATELRAELTALAGELPKTAQALRRDAADAAKEAAKEAEKLAAAEEAAAAKAELLTRRAATLGNNLEREASAMSRYAERGVNLGAAFGVALGGAVALGAGTVALMRTIGEASAGADAHMRALRSMGDGYAMVERATNGTLSATAAFRSQQALLNANVRISREEFATLARHAREHGDATKSVEERVQELTEALIGGEEDGLRRYGIAVDTTRSRTENLRGALDQMTRAAGENAPATRTAAEDLTRFNEALTLGGGALGALVDHATGARGAMAELGDEIRRVSQDILDLVERESQLPRNREIAARRSAALNEYQQAQRGIGGQLRGMGFSQEDVARLLPSTPLGNLTPEQIATRAQQLARIRTTITAQTADPGLQTGPRGPAAMIALDGSGGGQYVAPAQAAAPSVDALVATGDAFFQALNARRGGATREQAAQVQVRALLENLTREMAADAAASRPAPGQPSGQATAPNAPPRPPTLPQRGTGSAPSQPTVSPYVVSPGARIEPELRTWLASRERRVSDFGRNRAAAMDAGDALTAREQTETSAGLARLAQLRDREARDREARLDDLRVSVDQAEEVVRLRRQEERQSRPLFVARQNAILAAQADVAHQTRMVQLAAELSRVQSAGGREAQIAEDRAGAQLSRARGRVSRASERAELRDPNVFRERSEDAREERALSRERSQLQYRLDRQVTFTERMEELAGRRRTAAEMEAEGVTGAFNAMGEAYASHLQAVIQGKEDLGTALQGMLSDTLAAISKEASIKAGLYLAEGFASLVFYQYDRAANAFAAAGLYTAVAVGAGLGAGAIAPSKPAEGGAGGGASQDRGRPLDTGRGPANDNGRGGTTIIEQHYYAPVIGGRDATEAEVGRGVERYARAADRRRLGRTGS